jgi:hypothetical protein
MMISRLNEIATNMATFYFRRYLTLWINQMVSLKSIHPQNRQLILTMLVINLS